MAIVINGSGTVTGLSVGGLPDGTVDSDTLASNSVVTGKIADGTIANADVNDLAASKLTGALPAISGASLTGIPSNFTLLSTTTCSNTNDIDITLNTSYTENILRFSGIVMQNNNDTLRISMSDNNGSSYGTQGYCQLNKFTYDSGSWTEYSYSAAGAVTFANDLSNAAYKAYDAEMVFGQAVANNAQRNTARLIGNQIGSDLAFNLATLRWNEDNPNAVIKLRINGNAGGIASGTIKHYGVG
jgi:hypothetical protein